MNTHLPRFNLRRRNLLLGAAGFLCFAKTGAQDLEQSVHSFGIHPMVSPRRMLYSYQPLVSYLNTHIAAQNQLYIKTSFDIDRYRAAVKANQFPFITADPYDIPLALRSGYALLASFGDEEGYGGILMTRRNSGIKQISDLRGKTICYPSATFLASTLMIQYFLWQQGLDVAHKVKHVYLGSHEPVYLQISQGKIAAGGSFLHGWNIFSKRLPAVANNLEIKWQTPPLPGIAILVRRDIPEELSNQIRETLLAMHQTADGRNVLEQIGLPCFSSATRETYTKVERFLEDYQTNLGNPGFAGK